MSQQLSLSTRPRRFDDLLGQEKVTNELSAYYDEHADLPVALAFIGPRGTGKTSTARLCSVSMECEHRAFGYPCKACLHAYKYPSEGEAGFDITAINCARIKLDDLKRILSHSSYAPAHGAKFRNYILDELQAISSDRAQNFLLDILEDSPASTKFYFCTTGAGSIFETVLDRCVQYRFRSLKGDEVPTLVQKLLTRAKSDKDPDLLAEVLDERRITSPRAITQAVTKYLSGASPEDAVLTGEVLVDVDRIVAQVIRNDWEPLSLTLQELDDSTAREVHQRITAYMRGILLQDKGATRRRTASKAVARLTQLQTLAMRDGYALSSVSAALHDVAEMFGHA